MKDVLLTTVAFSVILLIGHQVNSITEQPGNFEKTKSPATVETIRLYFVIEDPIARRSELVGEVNYVHELVNTSHQINTQSLVSVGIEMTSTLYNMRGGNHPEWSSSGKNKDSFYVSEEGIYIFEKSYNITNRDDIALVVQYLVTTEGVGVPNVWLVLLD